VALWLPVIKVVLPYIGPIMHAALPVFTRKKSDKADQVVAQQVAELQDEVNRNAQASHALAKAVEEAARANDLALRQARLIAMAAIVIAVVALGVSAACWWLR
jgi:hypothetical protein